MQIILSEADIRTAVEDFARSKITIAANQMLNIDFATTRNPTGIIANLDIVSAEVTAQAPADQEYKPEPAEEPLISSGEERVEPEETADEDNIESADLEGSIFAGVA